MGTIDDAGTLCALVMECVVWWAAEERKAIEPTREAAVQLVELQDKIDAAIEGLCAAVAATEALCLRHGLKVDMPMWADDLGDALAEVGRRFIRWGDQREVVAMISNERNSLFQPRPGVIDLVRAARSVGVADSTNLAAPMRAPSVEWLRVSAPEVRPQDARAVEALRIRNGSKAASETAQLRLLFASLRELADENGGNAGKPGPLEWLTAADLSRLCCVAIGQDDPWPLKPVRSSSASSSAAARLAAHRGKHPWGNPAEGFDPETVQKARREFVVAHSGDRKT